MNVRRTSYLEELADGRCIPLAECIDRRLYRVRARIMRLGVFGLKPGRFFGIGRFCGRPLLEREWHWDASADHGTARPLEDLGVDPPPDIAPYSGPPGTWEDGLLTWLVKMERRFLAD